MNFYKFLCCFFIKILILTPAFSETNFTKMSIIQMKSDVLKVEAIRLKAMLDADIDTLDQITSESYVHVESSGKLRTKKQFLDGLRNHEYRFKSFVIDENNIQIFGSTAIVTGSYHNIIKTRTGIQPVKYARHIRIYTLQDKKWINVAHQATKIP